MENPDIVLVGAGIMSATLGVFLKELEPDLTIHIYERLPKEALESSSAWNNAGTGHSGYCELNYTTLNNGILDIHKAVKVAESFAVTRQFWSYLIENGKINNPEEFVKSVPHLSFVWGAENVAFLKQRHTAMVQNPLFSKMLFSEDSNQLKEWMPLVMENRNEDNAVAATYMPLGTDVNFGVLTSKLIDYLKSLEGVSVFYNHQVNDLKQKKSKKWKLKIENRITKEDIKVKTDFVFIGAGGGALLLLEKADIKEGEGYGGFPVSGQWLKCTNPEIIKQHHVKVYGKAEIGAPPMSVPHLDTRNIKGQKELLFGPFAGFSTKFLKNGSYMDLIKSIELDNIKPMLYAGWKNMPLTKYLVEQVLQSQEKRIEELRKYFPNAKSEDWELLEAGQRVQIIKRDEEEGGILEFGTESILSEDCSLAALLGASPGASTAPSIMLDLLQRCFKDKIQDGDWNEKLQKMIPSYGLLLAENEAFCAKIIESTNKTLKLLN